MANCLFPIRYSLFAASRKEKPMARWLKRGMDASAIKAADAKVRATVEQILADVEARRDAAVRDLSKQYDNWEPQSFRLTDQEIERAIAQVAKRDLEDIKFAQSQVPHFAQKQKETMRDLEVETLPGVILGHRHIPVASIGCYVPGGRYPMVAAAPMSIVAAKAARVRRPVGWGRRGRDLRARRRAGGGRDGARHRDDLGGRHDRGAGQCLCGGSQAPAVR